jgi:hypothetical protein
MPKPLTTDQIAQNIRNKYNGEYTLVTNGNISGRTKIQIRHICGNILETTHQAFVNDSKGRCHICYPIVSEGRKESITEEVLIKRIEPEYSYISGFKNTKVKIKVRHNECGNVFDVLPKDLFAGKSGCKVCANKNVRGKYLVKDDYLDKLLNDSKFTDGIEYEWLEEYKGNNKELHFIKHITCGNVYQVRPNDFQQGYRCPKCFNNIIPNESKNAKLIKEILQELNIPFTQEFTDSRCKHKQLLRFDFMIQLKNKKLLIEYDGEQHFRSRGLISQDRVAIGKLRDQIKNEFVSNNSTEFILERITYKDDVFNRINEIFTEHDLYNLFNIIL